MPRPRKFRSVCHMPEMDFFGPLGGAGRADWIEMRVDEFEAIRLIDFEGLTQEACASRMAVSRTTVQGIYDCARKKIADALVNGKPLKIFGGDYRLCEGGHSGCPRSCRLAKPLDNSWKGRDNMKIAVTYENGRVFQHFGHTEQFKIYQAEGGKLGDSFLAPTNGSGHGALAGFLKENGVDALICGGIGAGAQAAVSEAGIQLYAGVSGDADQAAEALVNGTLANNPAATCDHHEHQHHHGHDCGSHGCGSHGCGSHGCGEHRG